MNTEQDVGRVGKPTGLSQVEPLSAQGLDPTDFDPSRNGGPYPLPWPQSGERLNVTLVPRPKGYGVWWSLLDAEGFIEGGHISTHRSRDAAQAKALKVCAYTEARDGGRAA